VIKRDQQVRLEFNQQWRPKGISFACLEDLAVMSMDALNTDDEKLEPAFDFHETIESE